MLSLVVGLLVAVIPTAPASADPGPIASSSATGVTSDALPTAQIDGVVWSQAVVGSTVYAGGNFTKARPAGAAVGDPTEVTRTDLLAYDITTGALNPTFAPVLNGQIKAVAASPDGSRIYVGGSFTSVNGITRNRIAAFNTADGSLVAGFAPYLDSSVNAIAVTATAVYVGGQFSNAGAARSRLAAFDPATGALLAWAPSASGSVNALVVSPDGSRVVAGGSFTSMNGSSSTYGLAALGASDGSVLPWAANAVIQDAGPHSAILSLSTDGTAIYGTGYVFGAGGNFEGTFSADPTTGALNWMEDCHGDTYGAFGVNGNVYTVSHAHYCGNVGGFPQTTPTWSFHRALEFTAQATGTLKANGTGNYASFPGQPSPSMVNWFPDLTVGTFTGQNQAAWSVTGNANYVVLGGEFPTVNGTAQQGLVRFAVKGIAASKDGPRVSGGLFLPTLQAQSLTSVRISFPADWDRDDQTLTYKIVRNGALSKPIYTTTVNSQFWNRPAISFLDVGLSPGLTYQYRIFATDPDGNTASGDTVNVTLPLVDPGPYFHDVLNDGASGYWRLDEPAGVVAADYAGANAITLGTGVTHSVAGAVSTDTADTFSGTNPGQGVATMYQAAPGTVSLETWFTTTTTAGGELVGFGDGGLGTTSFNHDRQLYMDNAGHLNFAVNPGVPTTVSSPKTYNDGNWHHVVASLSAAGAQLYVDGVRVASNSAATGGGSYSGMWHVGGDTLAGLASVPDDRSFGGTLDEVAVYPTALSLAQIDQHYVDSGRTVAAPTAPTDNYGATVYQDGPYLYWRLDDASGPTAVDTSPNGVNGVYSGGESFRTASPVTGSGGTGVTFDGTSGTVGSSSLIHAPTVYSEEAWFSTTTTHGGKIIGFGGSQSGNSGNDDRHVYMLNNGQLVFGTYTGQLNLAQSGASYNDGRWHHVVATQGPDGMTLYVDGRSVATNPQTAAQSYSGYWRVGGDTDWGGDSYYFAGTIDEAAVYPTELTPAQVLAHYKASPVAANKPPVVGVNVSCTYLTCTFDATSSTDPDGTISSYKWVFGDGTTGLGATITHSYPAAGGYPASLTVTDNQGATASVSGTVTVTAPPGNQPPIASFTKTCTFLTCTFDGSGSRDPDGTVTGYSWNFGDGTTATGVAPVKVFAAAGSYPVTLTVTDNSGASSAVSATVSVVPNQPPTAAFTSGCASLTCTFDGSGSSDPDGTISSYAWNFGDGGTSTVAKPSHTFAGAGNQTVSLTVTDNGGLGASITRTVVVTANRPPVAAFTPTVTGLGVRYDGSSSTDPDGSIAAYAWTFGDGTTGAGATVSHTYAVPGDFGVTLTVTDNAGATASVTRVVTVAPVAPVAADAFGRTVVGGWGTADIGGAWTPSSSSLFAVATGGGTIALNALGAAPTAYLAGVSKSAVSVMVDASVTQVPTGTGTSVILAARHVGRNEYRLKLTFVPGGSLVLAVTRLVNGSETTISQTTVAGLTFAPLDVFRMRFTLTGTGTTTLTGKVWRVGTAEPLAPQVTATDSSSRLQRAGSVGVEAVLARNATAAEVVGVDNVLAY